MAETNPDAVFAEIAVELTILTEAQVEECRQIQETLRSRGLNPRSLAQLALEKKYVSREQIKQVTERMMERGVYPRLGGYEILGRIGSGGMGSVFRARQPSLDRVVAIKVLAPDLARDEKFVARFQREAKLAARISHPNAVQVFDVGEDAGRHFIVMEYVEGVSVSELLLGGPLEEERALEIVRDVAHALVDAHAQGIIHRDIKPGNILLRPDGIAKLTDLGLAKDISAPTSPVTLTRTGTTTGTPGYMSPEQCMGEKDVDQRSDIYSLGVTLFHMVCGQQPFTGDTPMSILVKHVQEPLPDPQGINRSVSDATAALIREMTAKNREERIRDCAEVAGRIEGILSGEGAPVETDTRTFPRTPPAQQSASAAGRPATPSQARPGAVPTAGRPRRIRRVVRIVEKLPLRWVVLVAALGIFAGIVLGVYVFTSPRSVSYEELMRRAMRAEDGGNLDEALAQYELARKRADNRTSVDAAIERVEHRIEQKRMLQEYEKAELEALRLVREGKLPQARKAYENAIEIGRNLDERPASYDKISAEVEKLKTREGKSP